MFTGKMKVNDVLDLAELDKFKEENLEGYQRERYEDRTSELVQYLTKCPITIMPAILVSLRETHYKSHDGDFGVLTIPRRKGAIWIIDGQHRVGGFGKIREKFIFSNELSPSVFSSLMDYEFPVVFIDSEATAKKVGAKLEKVEKGLTPEDVERVIFFIVNKTQKGISPSLKDTLLYRIETSGIQGLPMIEKENWRVTGAKIGILMNQDDDSPLKEKINISGKRDMGRPIQLNSFVSSLQNLLQDKGFSRLDEGQKKLFLKNYWAALKTLFPKAFEKKTEKNMMLLKALGVYSLHWLAKDIFQDCLKQNCDYANSDNIHQLIQHLSSFDWDVRTSPLSAMGGMKGVSKAHDLLLLAIHQQQTFPEKQTLGNYLN
jgi:DGQHR domain-containing protein